MSKFSEDLGEEFLIKKHLAIYYIWWLLVYAIHNHPLYSSIHTIFTTNIRLRHIFSVFALSFMSYMHVCLICSHSGGTAYYVFPLAWFVVWKNSLKKQNTYLFGRIAPLLFIFSFCLQSSIVCRFLPQNIISIRSLLMIICYLAFSLVTIWICSRINIKNYLFKFIGVSSLCFYLFHLLLCYFLHSLRVILFS